MVVLAGVEDLAAHAVASSHAEDDVKITVKRRAGATITEEALCRWSIERLPHYAVPRYIEFCSDLPRNGSGRVLKYELRMRGVTSETWDRMTSEIKVSKR